MSATSVSTAPSLLDPQQQTRLERDGYMVVDLVDGDVLTRLMDAFRELSSGIDSGYYPSLMSSDEAYKTATHERVRDLLWPALQELTIDYQPLLGVFMVKHPGPDTEVAPHQDWVVADESRRPTLNVWVPLSEVDDRAGRMRVLPGSHRWLEGLRGSPTFPTQWESEWTRVRDELMEPVTVGLGQAMLYDIRVLHGTPANRSDDVRAVASLYATPVEADTIHYYRGPDGEVEGYRVPSDFCTTFRIGDVPAGERFVEIPDYDVERLTFEEIAARHRANRDG